MVTSLCLPREGVLAAMVHFSRTFINRYSSKRTDQNAVHVTATPCNLGTVNRNTLFLVVLCSTKNKSSLLMVHLSLFSITSECEPQISTAQKRKGSLSSLLKPDFTWLQWDVTTAELRDKLLKMSWNLPPTRTRWWQIQFSCCSSS